MDQWAQLTLLHEQKELHEFIHDSVDCSLHGELVSGTGQDLVRHDDFLGSSPHVLMTPGVAPLHEVEHGQHREGEAARESLPANHREEKESGRRSDKTVLESAELISGHPILAVLQIVLRDGRNVRVLDEERN